MYKGKKVLAIIPARGGSKRLPNKNILPLAGKPLIAWTIEASLESAFIDKVIVSTDSLKIKEIALQYGAEIPFLRPSELATDTADSISVVKHTLDYFNGEFDYVVLLQPTSPLRTKDDIDNAFKMLKGNVKSVVSVCETEHSPLWANTLPEDLSMENFIKHEVKNLRSQDLPSFYRLNGAIYISEIEYLFWNSGFIGKLTKAFIMKQDRSIDIDTEFDFKLCDFLIHKDN